MREPIAPGVAVVPVLTPTLPPATHTNAVLLGEREVLVLDPASPWPDEQARLADSLTGCRVRAIVLTHHHADHVGGAQDLRERTGAPILAHPLTRDRLDFDVDGLLHEGDALSLDRGTWRVLHTPGHARGHICLHEPDLGVAVVGDMVAGVGTIVLDPPEGELGEYLASLERLRGLGARALVPAHGPTLTEPDLVLNYYIQHRHQRTAQVIAALGSLGYPARPADLVPAIYPELGAPFVFVAARQVLCHLRWLAGLGRAIEANDGRWTMENA